MSSLSRDILKWLQSLDLSFAIKSVKRDFSNGFLVAEILSRFYPRDIQIHSFSNGTSTDKKQSNWSLLKKFFQKYNYPVNDVQIKNVMFSDESAVISLLELLYTVLTNKSLKVMRAPMVNESVPSFALNTANRSVHLRLTQPDMRTNTDLTTQKSAASSAISAHKDQHFNNTLQAHASESNMMPSQSVGGLARVATHRTQLNMFASRNHTMRGAVRGIETEHASTIAQPPPLMFESVEVKVVSEDALLQNQRAFLNSTNTVSTIASRSQTPATGPASSLKQQLPVSMYESTKQQAQHNTVCLARTLPCIGIVLAGVDKLLGMLCQAKAISIDTMTTSLNSVYVPLTDLNAAQIDALEHVATAFIEVVCVYTKSLSVEDALQRIVDYNIDVVDEELLLKSIVTIGQSQLLSTIAYSMVHIPKQYYIAISFIFSLVSACETPLLSAAVMQMVTTWAKQVHAHSNSSHTQQHTTGAMQGLVSSSVDMFMDYGWERLWVILHSESSKIAPIATIMSAFIPDTNALIEALVDPAHSYKVITGNTPAHSLSVGGVDHSDDKYLCLHLLSHIITNPTHTLTHSNDRDASLVVPSYKVLALTPSVFSKLFKLTLTALSDNQDTGIKAVAMSLLSFLLIRCPSNANLALLPSAKTVRHLIVPSVEVVLQHLAEWVNYAVDNLTKYTDVLRTTLNDPENEDSQNAQLSLSDTIAYSVAIFRVLGAVLSRNDLASVVSETTVGTFVSYVDKLTSTANVCDCTIVTETGVVFMLADPVLSLVYTHSSKTPILPSLITAPTVSASSPSSAASSLNTGRGSSANLLSPALPNSGALDVLVNPSVVHTEWAKKAIAIIDSDTVVDEDREKDSDSDVDTSSNILLRRSPVILQEGALEVTSIVNVWSPLTVLRLITERVLVSPNISHVQLTVVKECLNSLYEYHKMTGVAAYGEFLNESSRRHWEQCLLELQPYLVADVVDEESCQDVYAIYTHIFTHNHFTDITSTFFVSQGASQMSIFAAMLSLVFPDSSPQCKDAFSEFIKQFQYSVYKDACHDALLSYGDTTGSALNEIIQLTEVLSSQSLTA